MIPLAAVAITAIIMLSIFARIDNWRRDWTSNFAELSDQADDVELRPITVSGDPPSVAEKIRQWANQQPRWHFESVQDEGGMLVVHLTRATRLFRFIDDIHVKLVPSDEGTQIRAQSQSRVGKGDLGQNPRNLKALVRTLASEGSETNR